MENTFSLGHDVMCLDSPVKTLVMPYAPDMKYTQKKRTTAMASTSKMASLS